jgi:ribosome maturation factor RimP
VLEAADPFSEEYVLEVSSPGIDRPLVSPEDYARFAGHEARIELVRGLDGRRRFKGTLIGLDGNDVVMDVVDANETRRVRFPFSDVAEAKLVLTDRLIQESLKARERREAEASH